MVIGDLVTRRLRLGARQARHQRAGHLALAGRLVERGWPERIRRDPDLRQQQQPARRCARQHQARAPLGVASELAVTGEFAPQRVAARGLDIT
jgi:hypothetical protein